MAQHHFGQSNHYNLIHQGFHRSVPSERISEFWSSLGSIGVFVVLVMVPWFRSQEFPTTSMSCCDLWEDDVGSPNGNHGKFLVGFNDVFGFCLLFC